MRTQKVSLIMLDSVRTDREPLFAGALLASGGCKGKLPLCIMSQTCNGEVPTQDSDTETLNCCHVSFGSASDFQHVDEIRSHGIPET